MRQKSEETAKTPLNWTDHALKRAQSRGVSIRIAEAVCRNADRYPYVGGGCRSFFVTRQQLARLADRVPAVDRERMDGVVLIMDPNTNTVISVLHPDSRCTRRYWRGRTGRRFRPRYRHRR